MDRLVKLEFNKKIGILRPNLVLFGDILPPSFNKATNEAKTSSLLIVIGSSLEVYPANIIPANCKRFIIINRDKNFFNFCVYKK